jgi:lysophospholipase L1-like esterase
MAEPLFLMANLLCQQPNLGSQGRAIAPQTCLQNAVAPRAFQGVAAAPHPPNSFLSGSQIYTQRLYALMQGQLHSSLRNTVSPQLWYHAVPQPTHQQWQQLLRQEAYFAATQRERHPLGILLGDSLSLWFPTELLPESKLWLNQGISGENTQQILNRLDGLQGLQADTIYLMAGVNDFKQGIPEAVILENLRRIIRTLRCQHPNTVIVVQSLLPTNHDFLQGVQVIRFNQQLQAIAQQENANYLNLYPLFVAANGTLRPELTTDGLHLSRAGYALWQRAVQNLENCLGQGRQGVEKATQAIAD